MIPSGRRCARTPWGGVKSETDLFTLLEAVEESSVPAFDQQDGKIRAFMHRRHYDEDEVTDYLEHGLLPTLTRLTYEYFRALLNCIRSLYHKYNKSWEGGPAKAMLDHHSKGLASVRVYSEDYRMFVLKAYVYLREAKDKKFIHASMSEALWSRVSTLEAPHATLGAAPPAGEPKYSHCRSKEVHAYLGLLPAKNHCPFASLKFNSAEGI